MNKSLKDAFAQQKTLELTAKLHGNAAAVFQLSFKSAAADALDQVNPPTSHLQMPHLVFACTRLPLT